MSKISIFVTHTPDKNDFLVRNPLFVNMIAGADYQTKPIPEEMTPDNTGDNISLKNRSYCELTTQYWAWKNAEADYYGFCHYRRFFTLSRLAWQERPNMKRLSDFFTTWSRTPLLPLRTSGFTGIPTR